MIDTFTPEPAAAWVSLRLQDARQELASRWRAEFPERELYISDLVAAIAECLCRPSAIDLTANTPVMRKAAELGVQRLAQGASVFELLREYHTLADLMEDFLLDQVRRSSVEFSAADVVLAMRCVTRRLRVVQQQSVDAFMQKHMETIRRQNGQLTAFGRLVAHEMRQPLGVLQLMAGVIPIREGDHELTYLLDLFDRNVRRLANVAGRLERLSHQALDAE